MAIYDEIAEETKAARDLEYGYEEEKKGKSFLDFIVEYLKQSKESKKPELTSMT